jgi:hypothetical protein
MCLIESPISLEKEVVDLVVYEKKEKCLSPFQRKKHFSVVSTY